MAAEHQLLLLLAFIYTINRMPRGRELLFELYKVEEVRSSATKCAAVGPSRKAFFEFVCKQMPETRGDQSRPESRIQTRAFGTSGS